MTTNPNSRCADHGHPTWPVPRCSACDGLLPYWHELTALAPRSDGHIADLRIDTGDFRLWTSRCSTADGEPFDCTVHAEVLDTYVGRWLDLGHYDGEEPPRGLPGLTPHALRGEVAR